MASAFTGVASERPMYSKIAASALQGTAPQHPTTAGVHAQKPNVISTPQDGTLSVSPLHNFTGQAFTPKQKKLVMQTTKDTKDAEASETQGPQVHVHGAESISSSREANVLEGMLMPNAVDESGTQVSSSSGSGKPPSLDGKSITSGTTFALDEKESLRPDDSASVNATEDEDGYPFAGSGQPASRTGSDDGVRAFRDQLREISSIQPSAAPSARPQIIAHGGHQQQGVLYVPPDGSGVGVIPGNGGGATRSADLSEHLPDAKLLEALESPKDRIMVLKLEQDIVDFVKDPKESSLTLPQTNAFYRMLAHKLADYYMLGHTSDESTSAVRIYKTPTCRIPPPLTGIATPSTAANTPPPAPPQMKILRRGLDSSGPTIANGSNTPFGSASENGEAGSEDKRPNIPASREVREAKYEEARRRIMGSAKPSDSPEAASHKDESRSSSAAGKKSNKKKQRADSDDDFEARSAYSAYYPTPLTAADNGPTYGYAHAVDAQGGQYVSNTYGVQSTQQSYSSFGAQTGNAWTNHAFGQQPSHAWAQNQQAPYDLSRNFQQAMSFQPQHQAQQGSTNPHGSFGTPYAQQYPAQQQQQWPQQSQYVAPFMPQQSYGQGYNAQQQQGAGQMGSNTQSYAYGQLPSQAFPGRPPSKLEHPLPGSYKSKHFNPQSQTFVPGHGHANFNNMVRGFPPQSVPNVPFGNDANRNGYALPYPPQRQLSGSSQPPRAPMGSPHFNQLPAPPRGPAAQQQPMVHPLPQPVFPHQPSPNVPLPPKPTDQGPKPGSSPGEASSKSTIAKWGNPASLPAKPPGGIPSFGSMPPMSSSTYGSSTSSPGAQGK